jgi:predicted metal-dependent phosphoesterase TrpH
MRAEIYANLHTHSTHSDGGFTPTQMVERAILEGYHAIAITDHDTATAYPELKAAADAAGIECIFGVEFSSPCPEFGENWTFHINGFHFDPEYPEMKQYLYEMSLRESDQTRQLFERGQRLGTIPGGVTWEEVVEFNKPITWLCNEQLWWFLLDRKLVKPEERELANEFFNI